MRGRANASRSWRSGITPRASARKSTPGSPISSRTRRGGPDTTHHPAGDGPAVRLSAEVARAIRTGRPVVALETSVLAHGLPAPHNAEAADRMSRAVRAAGAEPAFTAVVGGKPSVGLEADEIERFLHPRDVLKVSARDLSGAAASGADGATTVAGALALCRSEGIDVFATGGIGGVHRDQPWDESADLLELSRTPVVVVCSGAKSILDLPATVERLETLGVTVVGYRTSEFPGFHFVSTGLPIWLVAHSPEGIADILQVQRRLGHPAAVLVVQPPPADAALERSAVESVVNEAREDARRAGIQGPALTPFLLSAVSRRTGGRALAANLALLESNARLAGEVATCLTRRADS